MHTPNSDPQPLIYKDTHIQERGELLSLTDMWRAVGRPDHKRPVDWLDLTSAQTFIDYIGSDVGKSYDALIQTLRGNEAGTWAHWQIGLAYAKYLSPEFHAWCNQVVRDHMTGSLVPQIPQTYAAALRAAADAWEANEALKRDNELLNTIIDNEFGYCSILRAARHLGISETEFNWRPLKKCTLEMGMEVKRVPSPRFDYMNLYPIKAFEACYPQYDFSRLTPESVAERSVKLLTGQVHSVAH